MILEQNQTDRATLMEELRSRSGWAEWGTKYPDKEFRLRKILFTVQSPNFPGAVVPRLVQGRMIYYAVADSGKHWRILRSLLRSFIGTTLTDFQGLSATLDPSDPFEAFLADQLPVPISRFSPNGIRLLEQATVDALEQMVDLAEGEGRVQRALPRSTRQVLSDFRLSLAGGNDGAANEALTYLREQMRIDAFNLYFLEVERYEARRDWQGLIAKPFFAALTLARRPPKVTVALLEALYQTGIAPDVTNGEFDQVQTAFRERIRNPYGSLLKVLPPHPSSGIALLFLLEAYLEQNPLAPVVQLVKNTLSGFPPPERAIACTLLDSLGPPLYAQKRLDRLAPEAMLATPDGAMEAVVNALEVGSLVAFQRALAYLDRFSEADRERLLQQRAFRTLWKELTDQTGLQRPPSSWTEFLHALPAMGYTEVKTLAERAQVEWSVADQLATPEVAAELAAAIQQAWGRAPDEFNTLLPYLVEWVAQDDAWPNPVCLPLYEVLLVCLNLSDKHGQGLLDATSTLLHGCLKIGLTRTAYQTLLNDLGDRAVIVAGISTADWVLDLGEQTLIHPCPDPAARESLWTRLQSALVPVLYRLRTEQMALIEIISGGLGLTPLQQVQISQSTASVESPPSEFVAIYTLQEGVGQRVESILARVYPGVRVEVCTDLVATDRVKHLARTADHFVVCWQDAKHAVTQEVTRLRPRRSPVRWATGAGSSGVLRTVRECWAVS